MAALAAAALVAGPSERTPASAALEAGFTFTAAGDHGTGTQADASISTVATSGSSFYLAMGDLSYDSTLGGEQRWCTNFKSRFNDVEVLAGNHDTGESSGGNIDLYRTYCPFTLGLLAGDYGKQYFFDYPQSAPLARFIMIAPGVRGSLSLDYSATGAGYAFTRDAIDQARAAGIRWIVVGMHKNCISTGEKSCEVGTDLMNLLIQKKVDLVLQGHDHNYQRSHALSCLTVGSFDAACIADNGSDGLYAKGAGPVVVISGEFGRPLYSVDPADSEAGYFAKIDSTTFGVTRFQVTETSLSSDYLRSGGGTFADSFTITEGAVPPPTTRTTLTFLPTEDATILPATPTTNYGSSSALSVDNSPVENFLMKFDLTGIGNRRVVSAKLRLRATNGSDSGGDAHAVADNSWNESTVTWNTAPAGDPAAVASLGAVVSGGYYELDLTSLIAGDGLYGIRVDSRSGDGADFSSSESSTVAARPTLSVTVETATSPDTQPPTAPGSLTAIATAHDRVELSWLAAGDDTGVDDYTVYRNGVPIATTPGLSYVDTGVSGNTQYGYTVTASDLAGNVGPPSETASVTTPAAPPPPAILTFAPAADATVKQSFPTTNYGSSKTLDVDASPAEATLLEFSVAGIAGRSVVSAKLRLYVRNASNRGGEIRRVDDTSWSETTLTWTNAPAGEAPTLVSLGAVATGTWVEADVTAAVGGDGTIAFRLDSISGDGAGYSSKESAANRPQLVVNVAP